MYDHMSTSLVSQEAKSGMERTLQQVYLGGFLGHQMWEGRSGSQADALSRKPKSVSECSLKLPGLYIAKFIGHLV